MARIDKSNAPAARRQPQAKQKPERPEKPEKTPKQRALLDAAVATFLRYGPKKTSMDDVARAAGVSRQGLYLHWKTKDELFRDALGHAVDVANAAAVAAVAAHPVDSGADIKAGVVSGFVALHRGHFEQPIAAEHLAELMAAVTAVLGAPLHGLDGAQRPFFDVVEARLKRARVKQLRDKLAVLEAAALGLKHSASDLAAYERGIATAVDVVIGELP